MKGKIVEIKVIFRIKRVIEKIKNINKNKHNLIQPIIKENLLIKNIYIQ